MVGYMSLEAQVDADFSRARRRALLRRVWSRLRRDYASHGLLLASMISKRSPGHMRRFIGV